MRVGKALCGGVLALAAVSVGCGEGKDARLVKGFPAFATALSSKDVKATRCPGHGGASDRTRVHPTAAMAHSRSPVYFKYSTPPQHVGPTAKKPWLTKLPIAVRMGTKPVDVAIGHTSDHAKVGLAYDDWSAQRSPGAAFQRVRFMPCKGDPPRPTWHVWPGALVADRQKICIHLIVRDGRGRISGQSFNFYGACSID